MELEVGKKYVDRRGRVYGPLFLTDGFYGEVAGSSIWYCNGRMPNYRQNDGDLIAEHVDVDFAVLSCMPEQAEFVGEFGGLIYSNDPMHVLRAGVDQVISYGKWTPCTLSAGERLCDSLFSRVRYPKSAAPVKHHVIESPDDWVEITNPWHKLRMLIDYVWNSSDEEWAEVRGLEGKIVGQLQSGEAGTYTKARCLRKDLPVPQTAVYPGEKYRLIGKDELVKRHDEFCSNGNWYACTDTIGRKFGETTLEAVRRRKPFFKEVEPGEGFRLLEPHEVTLATDERTYADNRLSGWHVLSECNDDMIGASLADVREKHVSRNDIVVRRRIAVESGPAVHPGEGYRILEEHEITRPTDERLYPESPTFGWAELQAVNEMTIGAPVSVVRERSRGYRTMVIRRKVEPAVDTVEVELCVNKLNPYAFCLLARPTGDFKRGELALRFEGGKFYIDTPKAET